MIQNHHLCLDIRQDFTFALLKQTGERLVPLAEGRAQVISAEGDLLAVPERPVQVSAQSIVATALGTAQRVSVSAACGPLQADLNIDQYLAWPDCLILQWEFRNRSSRALSIQRLISPALRLLPALSDSLWTMQGAAVEWGQDFAFPLPEEFERQNFTGHVDNGEGGGIPMVYGWNAQTGLALAHVEPQQRLCSLPVQARKGMGVSFAVEEQAETELAPGQAVHSLRVLVALHHGDYFAPLALYRQIMARQGLVAPAANEEDYQPAWCSWGYEFDVRPEEVLGALTPLKEMGIHWLTLDDRWFDHYGDWNPRADTFPGGERQMRAMVDAIHANQAYAQLWWYPLCVEDGVGNWDNFAYGTSEMFTRHPDWLVTHPDGSVARNNRGLAILCPGLPEVQAYTLDLVRRFLVDWDYDGHKLDNIYTVPPCHNPAHHHTDPNESVRGFAELYRQIFETTRQLKPYSVTQICPCGTPITHTLTPALDQAVTADPVSSQQVRQRIKFYKGLLGPRFPVFADHVELADQGVDFASALGAGGVPATKFVWPEDESLRPRLAEWWGLSPVKEALWKKWFGIAARYPLADGEVLDLYDLAFDLPETHVVRKGERTYYAFYAGKYGETYQGRVTLRGLGARRYRLFDYVNEIELGQVDGPEAGLDVQFESALLIEVSPLK